MNTFVIYLLYLPKTSSRPVLLTTSVWHVQCFIDEAAGEKLDKARDQQSEKIFELNN